LILFERVVVEKGFQFFTGINPPKGRPEIEGFDLSFHPGMELAIILVLFADDQLLTSAVDTERVSRSL
jgi:hypothetical protein